MATNRKMGKRNYRKRNTRSSRKTSKISKPLRNAIVKIFDKKTETKVINVPDAISTSTNTVHRAITANSGLNYLAQDVFRIPQGVNDSSAIGSANRIGDRVKGVGFLLDYYFNLNSFFTLAGLNYIIPYVNVRVIVWRQAFGSPLLPAPLLLDSNYLALSGPTLKPISWDEGYVKDVLMDRVYTIRTQCSPGTNASGTQTNAPFNGMVRIKKYFKFPQTIKYCDLNSTSPNSTTMPIYVAITAECDEGSPFIPTGTNLVYITGYTKAWFKDA